MRKVKKKELNIKSSESKIIFGLFIMVIGLSIIISPFFNSYILSYIKNGLGYSAITWGLFVVFLSFIRI